MGYIAGPPSGYTNLTNTTAIGSNAQVTQSNSLILGGTGTYAVQVGIGNTAPHASALLEMTSTNKGLLIPRITQINRPASPATCLLFYQTDGTPGFYYYTGSAWQQLGGTSGWGLSGNAGTTSSNFIGTTDAQPLTFKVNGQLAGRVGTSTSTSFGYEALNANTGSSNSSFGSQSLYTNITGSSNTAVGTQSLYFNTASENTAVGYRALYSNTSGTTNVAIGNQALYSNTTAWYNTATGYGSSSKNTTGQRNTSNGYLSLFNNISGNDNTAFGMQALYNTTSSFNSAFGKDALVQNTTGTRNMASGYSALYYNTTGSNHVAIGCQALEFNTTGTNNVAVGYNTLRGNYTGSYLTAIGDQANASDGLTNATVIGYGAIVTASNTIQLGNTSVTRVNTSGDIYAKGVLLTSDQRFKYQVRPDVKGLDFIMELKPVTYLFDNQKLADFRDGKIKASELNSYVTQAAYNENAYERKTGFLAQQVEQAAKKVGYTFDGVRAPKDDKDIYTVSYSTFVVPLVKAVQEQQQIIDTQNKKIEQQEKLLADLLKEIEQIKAKLK